MVFLYGTGEFSAYTRALGQIGQQVIISQDLSDAARCSGLLLPGGGDIHGSLDEKETRVIDYFVAQKCPILGICRGLQALNVYFGGTLYDYIPGHQSAQGDITHPTRAVGWLSDLLGECPTVNSNHHQAVCSLGCGLLPCQWACDGIVECLFHKTLPLCGVQWHPERWNAGAALFSRFADMLRK